MTKLASRLPKESDENALDDAPVTGAFLRAYNSQAYIPVVALIRTKEVVNTEDFVRVPTVEIAHVEAALDDDDAEDVRGLLQRLHDQRVGHRKQPLDLPEDDEADDADARLAPALQIEAGDVVDAELVEEEA